MLCRFFFGVQISSLPAFKKLTLKNSFSKRNALRWPSCMFHKLKFGSLPILPIFSSFYFPKEKLLLGNFQKSSFYSVMYSAGTQQSTVCLCFISEYLFFLKLLKPEQSRTFITWAILKVRHKVYLTKKVKSFQLIVLVFLIHLLHWPGFALLRLTLERWYYWKWATEKSWMQSRFEDMQLLFFIKLTKPNMPFAIKEPFQ